MKDMAVCLCVCVCGTGWRILLVRQQRHKRRISNNSNSYTILRYIYSFAAWFANVGCFFFLLLLCQLMLFHHLTTFSLSFLGQLTASSITLFHSPLYFLYSFYFVMKFDHYYCCIAVPCRISARLVTHA